MIYINSVDGRFGLSEFDRFRKKWAATGGNGVDSNTTMRRGSLDRRTSYSTSASSSGTLNASSNIADNRYSWSSDDFSADAFRPVTLTVNGFFKQVCKSFFIHYSINTKYCLRFYFGIITKKKKLYDIYILRLIQN